MKFDKTKYQDLQFNDFKWIYWDRGLHCFQKKESNGFSILHCSEEQIANGDLEYMTLHGITLSKERQNQVRSEFSKKQYHARKEKLRIKNPISNNA